MALSIYAESRYSNNTVLSLIWVILSEKTKREVYIDKLDEGLKSMKLIEERLSVLETYWKIPVPVTESKNEEENENFDGFRIQPVPHRK